MVAYIEKDVLFSFDDVLLKPRYSEINSRRDIDLHVKLHNISLDLPILSANMDTVTSFEMAHKLAELGCAGVLHRFQSREDLASDALALDDGPGSVIISLGVQDIKAELKLIDDLFLIVRAVCIDVAHGHSKKVVDLIKRVKKEFPNMTIIAGNVATGQGARLLAENGADVIKVGVGPGSLCSTRIHTGAGVPQLSAILEVSKALKDFDIVGAYAAEAQPKTIIADGGIRNAGDIVKCLAAGAHTVMLGSLLAGCHEAPGKTRRKNGALYKSYRGSASHSAQLDRYGDESRITFVEGEMALVPYKGPVERVIRELEGGIRSGFSYCGARNLQELHKKAVFVRVSQASTAESQPHNTYKLGYN